jgi:hypothetical protein
MMVGFMISTCIERRDAEQGKTVPQAISGRDHDPVAVAFRNPVSGLPLRVYRSAKARGLSAFSSKSG